MDPNNDKQRARSLSYRGEVSKEGSVGRGALDSRDELDGAIGDVGCEVVVVLSEAGFHVAMSVEKDGLKVVRVRRHESVEVIEPFPRRPIVERATGTHVTKTQGTRHTYFSCTYWLGLTL